MYNPKLAANEETEGNKLLFYYPLHIEKNTQLKNLGICQAVVGLALNFKESSDLTECIEIENDKTRQAILQVENNFYFAIVIINYLFDQIVVEVGANKQLGQD